MPDTNPVTVAFLSIFITLLGKVLYDYLREGRAEKTSPFVTLAACQQTRDHCNLGVLKEAYNTLHTEFATFKAETKALQKEIDKRLNESNFEFRSLRKDIMEIKEAQSRTNALLEPLVENLKK